MDDTQKDGLAMYSSVAHRKKGLNGTWHSPGKDGTLFTWHIYPLGYVTIRERGN